jgi:dihydrofolate reductase
MTTISTDMPLPSLTIIVAASSSRLGIGLKGALPWRLKRELAYFKRATTYHPENRTNVVIMGRKCWESIPPKFRPLLARYNIVLSRKGKVDGISEQSEGVEVVTSLSAALTRLSQGAFGRVFIIGGGEVYREAMEMKNCDRILFTEVKAEIETDVDFPVDFRKDPAWTRKSHDELESFVGGEVQKGDIVEGELSYDFQMWETNV